jgi:hypothetical protein
MIHELRIAWALFLLLLLLLEIPDCAFQYSVILDRGVSWRAHWVPYHGYGGRSGVGEQRECRENSQMVLSQDQRIMERTLIRPPSPNHVVNQIKDVGERFQTSVDVRWSTITKNKSRAERHILQRTHHPIE